MSERLTELADAVLNAVAVAKESQRAGCVELAKADALFLFELHDAHHKELEYRKSVQRVAKVLMGGQ